MHLPLIHIHLVICPRHSLRSLLPRKLLRDTVCKIQRVISKLRITFFPRLKLTKSWKQFLRSGFPGKQAEFISADPKDLSKGRKRFPGCLTKGKQISITRIVPVSVIQKLQVIQVEHNGGKCSFFTGIFLKNLVIDPSVMQLCHRIYFRVHLFQGEIHKEIADADAVPARCEIPVDNLRNHTYPDDYLCKQKHDPVASVEQIITRVVHAHHHHIHHIFGDYIINIFIGIIHISAAVIENNRLPDVYYRNHAETDQYDYI